MQEQQRLLDGRYQIINKLGKGAWARTYLVEDTLVKRPDRLVVKQFKQPASSTQAIKEFEALLELFDPHNPDPACRHLPWIYEVHPVDHEAHVIMDYIRGPTLKEVASEFPWPLQEWWTFARSLLGVLELLEEHHLLHRDIKPENIILHKGDRRQPILIDFGFATPRSVTTIGAGTLGYLPPEAGWSRQPPESSDRYALSVVLFQILTGQEPISELATDGYTRIVRMPPSVDKNVLPLANVLLTAIATDPAQRPRSASELRKRLEKAMKGVPKNYKPPPPELSPIKNEISSTPTLPVRPEDSPSGTLDREAPIRDALISIFISYSHSDSSFVDRLEADLRKRGFSTWVDRRGLEGGQKWRREIEAAIDRSQVLLVVLSPDAVASESVQQEYAYASEEGKVVIPLYHRPCKVPLELRNIQWIDFQGSYEQGFASLMKALHRQQDHVSPPPTSQEIRNRQRMLTRVRTFWIDGFLDESLHGAALIALGLSEQRDAIANPWRLILQQQNHAPSSLPSGTHITQVFDKVSGELLILGEPGSGKTTLLLELTRDLLDRAQKDDTQPIPVVFNLSSWAVKRQPLIQWLVEELNAKYQVPRKVGQHWVDTGQLLLLLDGLDEVAPDYRAACIDAINIYRSEHGLEPMVVCSRTTELLSQTKRLQLQSAVVVQPLTLEQIEDYLTSAGEKLAGVRQAFDEDKELQELATTPLMLSMITLAYSGMPVEKISVTGSLATGRQQVLTTYVQRMLQRRGASHYDPDQIRHRLTWLAQQMKYHNQTEYYLERMQMTWVPASWLRWLLPGIAVGLVYGLFLGIIKGIDYAFMSGSDSYHRSFTHTRGLMDGVLIGIVNALLFAFLNGFVFGVVGQRERELEASGTSGGWRRKLIIILEMRPVYGLLMGLFNGLLIVSLVDPLAGALNGLFIGIVYAALGKLDPEIHPAEVITWSWTALRQSVATIIGAGMLIGLFYGLFTGLFWMIKGIHSITWFLPCLLFGLSIGFVFGLIVVLFRGLSHNELDQRNILKPNQGIWNSAKNSALLGLLCWLLFGLFFGVIYGVLLQQIFQVFGVPVTEYGTYFPKGNLIIGVANGLAVAAFVWARSGGIACIQHLVLRILLWRAKCIPRKYPHFLDDMAERLLLCKVGGGYVFIHRLLLEHFAALYKEANSHKETQQIQVKFQIS